MITCPNCGQENIKGSDHCEECGSPLVEEPRSKSGSSLGRSILKDTIEDMQPKAALSVTADTPMAEVLDYLINKNIGCVPITEDGQLVGIFSERDALQRLNVDAAQHAHEPISKFMTPKPESLQLGDKIAYAVQRMDLGDYRHIPILREGKIIGMVSVRDILRYMSEDLLDMET